MMTTYDLVREDWDSIVDLNQFPGQPNKTADIPSKVCTCTHTHTVHSETCIMMPQSSWYYLFNLFFLSR